MSNAKLVFEIGTEELPSAPLYAATEKLSGQAAAALDEARIAHGEVKTCSTPRRIILTVDDVASSCDALSIKAKGPAAKIAFDEAGNPTKAAAGFARGKGVSPEELVRETDEKGVEYVYAIVEEPARPTLELLPDILTGLAAGISWPRSQRWGRGHVTFARPIRWIVALLGSEVVDVEYAGVKAGRATRGHRLMANRAFEIASAETFFDAFEEMKVIPSAAERAARIREQVAAVEEETGLSADMPKGTFDEVVNLVEYPTVLVGHFDERFLDVPPEIITDAMLEHQRYFPMYRADGSLDNAFIVVSNGDPVCSQTICEGNERVVRARLDDAAFFVAEDERVPLESYVDKLKNVVFQEKLGSVYDKTQRIVALAGALAGQLGLEGQDCADAKRAALLAKADLVTEAVVEFTSLQGVMGGHYALASGETPAVAQAIREHYHPRFSGDEVPGNTCGKVVAIADKLDTVCGIFAIGQGPTGSSDPFALRRAALGIINIMKAGVDVSLVSLVNAALDAYEAQGVEFDRATAFSQVIDFFITRTKVMLRDGGSGVDAIDAVLAAGVEEPLEFARRVNALETARAEAPELFENLAIAYARANNLRDETCGVDFDENMLNEVEHALSCAVVQAEGRVARALEADDYKTALAELAALRKPIDLFFERIMVMDEDLAVRANRMKLLNRFVAVFSNVADFGKLAK